MILEEKENFFDKYNSKSERLDNATFVERFVKFAKIIEKLKIYNIELVGVGEHTANLEDKSCGYTLGHAITTWEIFRIDDVVDMIVRGRDKFIERKEKINN